MSIDSISAKATCPPSPSTPLPRSDGEGRFNLLRFGSLTLPSRWILSPLAGYTTLPFRLALRELGGLGMATTDLVNARALVRASKKTMELIDTTPEDRPLAIQLYGADA